MKTGSGALPRLLPGTAFPRSDLRAEQDGVKHSSVSIQLRLNGCRLLTIEAVQSLAVPDDGQRVVVVELVVELVRVGVQVRRLRRRLGALVRRVLLLTGVVRVAALGAEGRTRKMAALTGSDAWRGVPTSVLTSLCPEERGAGCRRCAVGPWNSAFLPPRTATSVEEHSSESAPARRAVPPPASPLLFAPRFCGFRSAASPCCRWSLIFWAGGCRGRPSAGSSRKRLSSCSGRL